METELTPDELRQRVAADNLRLEREALALSERRRRLENLLMQQAALMERLEADLAERVRLRQEEQMLLSIGS